VKTLHRLISKEQRSDAGFTLIEVLMVVAMSALLGIAITASIMGSMTFFSQVQVNAVQSAKNAKVFTELEQKIRGMDTLQSATSSSLGFIYRDTSTCQYHVYTLETDTNHNGRLRLRHTITSESVSGLLTCDSVSAALTGGTITPQVDRVEASDLGSTSAFKYNDGGGQTTFRLGDLGYNAATVLPLCQIAGVNLTLYTRFTTRNSTEPDLVENVTVSILNNVRGLNC
jgi:prepilin-type N-terminal cleavage/methylation domain-containing protein